MLENKFFHLFVTFVWMGGLFGVVLTLAHIFQQRRRYRQYASSIWKMPRNLIPLYGSLAIFCLGLALQAVVVQQAIFWGVAAIWGGLALLFIFRMFGAIRSTANYTASATSDSDISELYSGRAANRLTWGSVALWIAFVLLLMNAVLIGWWATEFRQASQQVPVPISTPAQAESLTPIATATGVQQPTQESVTPQSLSPQTPSPEVQVTPSDATSAVTATLPAVVMVVITPTELLPTPSPQLEVTNTAIPSEPVVIPQPTPTLLLTPTVMPSLDSGSGSSIIVQSDSANVRTAPDLAAEVLTILPNGAVAAILGRTADSQWFLIPVNETGTGWISALVVEVNVALESLPVVESPTVDSN